MTWHKQTPQERCGYCGRFMRTRDFEGWDTEPYCARQNEHILADPEHWTVYVENLLVDGAIYTGPVRAEDLEPEELRTALGLPVESATGGAS